MEEKQDTVLGQVEVTASIELEVPPGYQRIRMSTKGKFGAPEYLHIRNFSVEEALALGSIAQDELPIKVNSLLQAIIFEKDVDISKFYEAEVSELCIHFYEVFYSNTLKEIQYKVTDADKEWMLKNIYKGTKSAEYQNWLRGIENGQISHTYDIDLRQVRYYTISDDAKKYIKYKNGDFSCVFQYPRFGDSAILQKALKEKFRQQDITMGPLYKIFKNRQDAEERLRRGENIAINQIPDLDAEDEKAVRQYELEKTAYIITTMKGMYLKEFDGKDVSEMSLTERVELAKDPRIDFSLYQTVSEAFNKLEVGPVPKVSIINPITGAVEEIDHPFRPLDLLTAIKHYKSDKASIEFI